MKISVFLLFCCLVNIFAAPTYSQTTKISLNLKDATIEEVLNKIEDESEFYFLYNQKLIDVTRKVNIEADKEPIVDILNDIFNGDTKFIVYDRQIILTPNDLTISSAAMQQQKITGTVTDKNGPIPGANVVVTGTTLGAITDYNGKFSIEVPQGSKSLSFSFIGMEPQEISIGTSTQINITMAELAIGLDEVVVIGYGTSSRKKLTTATATIKAEELQEIPISNIADAFTGRVAGIIADNGSGDPGSKPIIRIRGYGSINAGSEPLYVIDGMVTSATFFNRINPKTIQSIDILKDAAAGAIYGSRAGNGVIIVTTKKGQVGKTKFSVNSTTGIKQLDKKVKVLNAEDWIAFTKEGYTNSGQPIPAFYSIPNYFANTNWQDEVYQLANFQNHQVAMQGSSEKVKYYMSVNYLYDEGIIITTSDKTISTNGSFDMEINPKLRAGVTYNAAHILGNSHPSIGGFGHAWGVMQEALYTPPVIPVYLPNGDYGEQSQGIYQGNFEDGYINPVRNLKENHSTNTENTVMGKTYLTFSPIKGFSLTTNISASLESNYSTSYNSPAGGHSYFSNISTPMYNYMGASQGNGMSVNWMSETFANYERTFAEDHQINVVIGYSLQYDGYRSTSAYSSSNDRGASNAENPIPAFNNIYRPNIYGAALVLGGGGFSESTFQSYFGRLNYSYKDKYMFMGSLRQDASSKFAPDKRVGYFPALSAAWRLTKEPFMESLSKINELKLRMSWGISGNDQIGNYMWRGTVNYGGLYTFGSSSNGGVGTQMALFPSSFENRNLQWETNTQSDLGIDLSMFKSRINLSLDLFIRKTTNMLMSHSLPSENGIAGSVFENIGNMDNRGIEINLNTVNIKTSDFTWTTNFIFSKINNKVDKVFTPTGYISTGWGNMLRISEGRPMFEIYGYKAIGNYKNADDLAKYPGQNRPQIGDIIYENYKPDDVLNGDDWQVLGHALPDFTYGFSTDLKYKDFDLSVVIDGSQGVSKVVSALREPLVFMTSQNTLQMFFDNRFIAGVQENTMYSAPSTEFTGARHMQTSALVWDASYTRIKNIVLGYNVPKKVCGLIRADELRFTIGVQNAYNFNHYPLYNPQANSTNGAAGDAQFGLDQGVYPLARIYTVGINLTF